MKEEYIVFYSFLWQSFLPIKYYMVPNTLPIWSELQKFRGLTKRGLTSNFVETNCIFPICLIPRCKEHKRHYEALFMLTKNTTCVCSEFRWYKIRQNNRKMSNFDTYIIYVYDCC